MPIPRVVARFNRVGPNRLTLLVAPWAPGLGVLTHRGRRSGRSYRTPVNVFRSGDRYLVACTYGAQSDWVKNVLAADGCELVTHRRDVRLVSPRLVHDERRRAMPAVPRFVLGLLRVTEFVVFETPADQD